MRARKQSPTEPPTNEEETLRDYIDRFVQNGLQLQDELMVDHESIAVARCQYLPEFYRRRDIPLPTVQKD